MNVFLRDVKDVPRFLLLWIATLFFSLLLSPPAEKVTKERRMFLMFIFCPRRQKTNQKSAAQGERFRSQKSRRAAFLRPSTFSPLWIPLLLFEVGENNSPNETLSISPRLSVPERSASPTTVGDGALDVPFANQYCSPRR